MYRPAYTRADAAIYGVTMLAATLVVALAWSLEPSPRGFGTHEKLGLPPCPFLRVTGLPCPSCGLTTCFAHAAKLDFRAAAKVHPFGLVQFFLTAGAIPLGGYLAARRVPFDQVMCSRSLTPLVWAWLGLYLLGWLYKVVAFL